MMARADRDTSWSNWTGDQACRPARLLRPPDGDRLAQAVAAAAAAGERVSVVGSGHSFTDAALTDGTLIEISSISGIVDADPTSGLVEVAGGTTLADLNRELDRLGLAMPNLGDIDRQTIAGTISTGTHGTGIGLPNISAQVEAVELVDGGGGVRRLGADAGDLLRAARVGVGALGAISSVTLRTVPAFSLHRIDAPMPLERVLADFDELASANDHFELFIFPYTRSALTIRRNRTDRPLRRRGPLRRFVGDVVLENGLGELMFRATRRFPAAIPRATALAARAMSQGEQTDLSHRVFANLRSIRFTEMEYAVAVEHGPEALSRVLELIERERPEVAMPIECRVVGPDDALLSPAHERRSAYLAVHQYRGMPWRGYFEQVEGIMASYGGRPHWGKRHSLGAAELAGLYPRWDAFQRARDELDPARTFTNAYAERVLGP